MHYSMFWVSVLVLSLESQPVPATPPAVDGSSGPADQRPAAKQKAAVQLAIDHVTIAGSDLSRMRDAFAALGLKTEYGGAHSNGITHMALVGFDDGSYIELVSTVKPGETNIPIWKKLILEDGGPSGWAARSTDVAAEAKRVAELGVTVQGPFPGGRTRPDGIEAQWKLAFLGNQPIGAVLPFLIEDVTPRENRVKPTAGVAGGELTGVAAVVIGVKDLAETIKRFRRIYHWPAPQVVKDSAFGAKLACFEDSPVILAAPLAGGGWLSERITRFGETPVAFLLKTTDFKAACKRFDVKPSSTWFGRRVAWFDREKLNGTRMAVIDSKFGA